MKFTEWIKSMYYSEVHLRLINVWHIRSSRKMSNRGYGKWSIWQSCDSSKDYHVWFFFFHSTNVSWWFSFLAPHPGCVWFCFVHFHILKTFIYLLIYLLYIPIAASPPSSPPSPSLLPFSLPPVLLREGRPPMDINTLAYQLQTDYCG